MARAGPWHGVMTVQFDISSPGRAWTELVNIPGAWTSLSSLKLYQVITSGLRSD